MTPPWPGHQRDGAAVPAGPAARPADPGGLPGPGGEDGASPPGQGAVLVVDSPERRIRKPVDLLRLLLGCAGLALLAGAALVTRATARGAEADLATAWRHLPRLLPEAIALGAGLAMLLLPAALAVVQLVRRQPRRLAEAVATSAVTAVVVVVADWVLRLPAAASFRDALVVPHGPAAPLDGYLAVFATFVTAIDLHGRPRWRGAVWVAAGAYAVSTLVAGHTTALSLAISALLGRTVGVGMRYAAGLPSQRPPAAQIAAALAAAGLPVTQMRRAADDRVTGRAYRAATRDGTALDVVVLDRDQEAAGALYRFYRALRLRGPVARGLPLSVKHTVERKVLMSYATADAGVATPRLRAAVRAGQEASVLAYDHCDGATLAERGTAPAGPELRRVWRTVLRLHAHGVTHRALTADRILVRPTGEVALLDPGYGDVAATELGCRLDLAQLLTELALLAGPDPAADAALAEVGPDKLAAVVPLLQPVALYRSTRAALRGQRDLLPALRARLAAAAPGAAVPVMRLERVRPRTLVSLVAGVLAAYLLAAQIAQVSFTSLIRAADWRWTIAALGLSALTYLCAAASLSGFVLERLRFGRTCLAQLATSFVTLVAPAAVGGAALNIRYLQRNGVPAAKATASVGAAQAIAFVLHSLLLLLCATLAGTSQVHSLRPPVWVFTVLAGLVAALLAMLAVPAARRLVRARLVPTLSQVLPRLLDVARSPRKLAEGIGGTLLLTAAYVGCLAACVRALGGAVPLVSIALLYLAGSALGSAAPTPGGIGAVEVALSAGLTAAGLTSATALSAVLLFRLLTFWLPVPVGWAAFTYLQRRQEL